jgi:hypothetical protein
MCHSSSNAWARSVVHAVKCCHLRWLEHRPKEALQRVGGNNGAELAAPRIGCYDGREWLF